MIVKKFNIVSYLETKEIFLRVWNVHLELYIFDVFIVFILEQSQS